MVTSVPPISAAGWTSPGLPLLIGSSAPSPLPLLEIMDISDTDAILARASPRNPRVSIENRSLIVWILLV